MAKINVLMDWAVASVGSQLYIERNEEKVPIVKDLWLTDEQYKRLGEPASINVTIEGVL